MPRRKTKMHGEGPAWDWIKGAAKSVHGFVKDRRLVSRGLSALASSGLTPYSAGLSRASSVANKLGYGNRKSKTAGRKTMKGKGTRKKSATVGRKRKAKKTHKR